MTSASGLMSFTTFTMPVIISTQSSSVRALSAPMVPPVVRPMCATMMSAPTDTTAGTPFRAAALQRSGPAASTPPTTSSHHSVVVRSSTPLMNPPLTSASMHFPPVPVAWKTSTSKPFDSR